jgi:hypothetical protein
MVVTVESRLGAKRMPDHKLWPGFKVVHIPGDGLKAS